MVLGISFIAFLTAGVTSTVIQRGNAKAQAVERAHDERDAKTILDALVETRQAITELDARLDRIEIEDHGRRLAGPGALRPTTARQSLRDARAPCASQP